MPHIRRIEVVKLYAVDNRSRRTALYCQIKQYAPIDTLLVMGKYRRKVFYVRSAGADKPRLDKGKARRRNAFAFRVSTRVI